MELVKILGFIPVLLLILINGNDTAQASEEGDLSLIYGDEEIISIATGTALAERGRPKMPVVAKIETANLQVIQEKGITEIECLVLEGRRPSGNRRSAPAPAAGSPAAA